MTPAGTYGVVPSPDLHGSTCFAEVDARKNPGPDLGRRPANECVERRPIRFAKSCERFPRRFVGVALARLQYDRPMRRLEWRTALLQRPWNRFRR